VRRAEPAFDGRLESPRPKLSNVEDRRAGRWVVLALFALGGLTLLLALVVTAMLIYTWLTDGTGA
jgi:hypothetical protein